MAGTATPTAPALLLLLLLRLLHTFRPTICEKKTRYIVST